VKGGIKKISEISPHDEVESLDLETGKVIYIKPSRVLCNPTENSPKLKLTFDDGTEYICTEDHLFYTKNRKWVKACELSEEDDLEVPA
jgi:intein/homing endonuclease